MEKISTSGCKVCVTGGAGYVGSWLVKKLLDKGYTVHATLRNLDDLTKVSLLKSFPGSETRLVLFKADMFRPEEFENAIRGCQFVFHVATPFEKTPGSEYKNTSEAAVASVKSIATACKRSGTVKRLVFTASVFASSPLKDDGSGFKDFVDETCWSPSNLSVPYGSDFLKAYQDSKVQAEKEMLRFGKENEDELGVVSLTCGLVGGGTLLSYTPGSVAVTISQLTNNAAHYSSIRYLEELMGKVPLIHIDDVCEAHIFCMENPSVQGRILCASSFVASAEIASYFQQNYPQFHVKQEYLDGPKRQIKWASSKLTEKGFVYKYDMKTVLDDCVSCAKRMGDLQE